MSANRVRLDVGGGGRQRADMATNQEDLSAPKDDVGFLDLRPAGADRLDFPALKGKSCLEAFLDEVVVEGLLVVNNAHGGFALEFA